MNILHFKMMLLLNKTKSTIIILTCCINFIFCQDYNYNVEVDIFSHSQENEYWWTSKNNGGRLPNKDNFSLYLLRENSSTTFKLTLSNGFYENQKLKLGESFIMHQFSDNLFLRFGKYYRDFSLYLNDEITSGSMLVSNNAQPLPKIGLVGIYKLKKNNNLSFKWGISHGFFKKNIFYSDAPYLHEKFFYLNFSKNNLHDFSFGIVHEAIWAGTTTQLGSSNNPGNQPDSFKDFIKVFISADGPLIPGEAHANALGSHIGIWDFSYVKKLSNKNLKIYYQHYFEDTSSFRFANKTDGLWGIEFENYLPQTNFLIEYLDTSHCCIDPPYQNDNYYSNYQYRDGWKYNNMTIGNPFVNNNRSRDKIRLFHLGFITNKKKTNFQMKASKITNRSDQIKFKVVVDKKINKSKIYFFIVGNEINSSVGLGISYLLY